VGSRADTVQFICDQAGLGARLTFRKMFGEYALYLDGKVVALVCDDQLFLKPTPEGRALLGAVPEGSPYPGCRPFLMLAAELDNPERLSAALEITARVLSAPKAKAKAKKIAPKPASSDKARNKAATRRANRTSKTVIVKLRREGAMCAIPVPFEPRAVFGKVRAPVKVTLKGYSYRSTIFSMGRGPFIPLRASHRQAAGLEGNETLKVRMELDTDARTVTLPPDLRKALAASKGAREKWQALSYTHQREHVEAVEDAKKPETRTRRIDAVVAAMKSRP
jgi:TfoX/Sxy family transcriptional regulator of competence genes